MNPITRWQHYGSSWLKAAGAWARRPREARGAAFVEYALLLALIAMLCIGAITLLGGNLQAHFSQVGSAIN